MPQPSYPCTMSQTQPAGGAVFCGIALFFYEYFGFLHPSPPSVKRIHLTALFIHDLKLNTHSGQLSVNLYEFFIFELHQKQLKMKPIKRGVCFRLLRCQWLQVVSNTRFCLISMFLYQSIISGNRVRSSRTNPFNVIHSAQGRPPSLGAGWRELISTHTIDSCLRLPC